MDLISVANELESEANLLPPSQIEHSTNLKNIAIMLESYQLKVISKVHHSVVSIDIVKQQFIDSLTNNLFMSVV